MAKKKKDVPKPIFKPATPGQIAKRQEYTCIRTLSEIEAKIDKINGKLDVIKKT